MQQVNKKNKKKIKSMIVGLYLFNKCWFKFYLKFKIESNIDCINENKFRIKSNIDCMIKFKNLLSLNMVSYIKTNIYSVDTMSCLKIKVNA